MPPTPANHAPTGDCIGCGFERRGAPWTTCPECGADADARERLRARTAAAATAIAVALGMALSLLLLRFLTIHAWLALAGSAAMSTARTLEWDAVMRSTTFTSALLLAATLAAALLTSRALAGTEHRSLRARILTGMALALAIVGALVFGEQMLHRAGPDAGGVQQSATSQVARSITALLRSTTQQAPVLAGALLVLALLPEFPALRRARARARLGAVLAALVVVLSVGGLAVPLPPALAANPWFPVGVLLAQIGAAAAALAACSPFFAWMSAQRTAPERRAPGEPLPPGAALTPADAMERGGIPLGLVVGLLGVMPWVIWSSPSDDALLAEGPPAWMTLRWCVTAAAALAWVIPAYLLPNPRAARWWKWSAAATILAAAALAGR